MVIGTKIIENGKHPLQKIDEIKITEHILPTSMKSFFQNKAHETMTVPFWVAI